MNNSNFSNQNLLSRIGYWNTPYILKKFNNKRTTNLKIAILSDENLYNGLDNEAELYLLTPENWENILTYIDIDLLLVGSTYLSVTNDWYMNQLVDILEIKKIIDCARKKGIKSAYWITHDVEYFSHFNNLAKCFDKVFCSDCKFIKTLAEYNIDAEFLEVCVQPTVYNSFTSSSPDENFQINILYDGLVDIYRNLKEYKVLEDFVEHGIKIIDSNAQLFRRKFSELSKLKSSILGCVTFEGKAIAYKHANCLITFSTSNTTETQKKWLAIEAAASRVAIVNLGHIEDDDLRKSFVIEVQTVEQLKVVIEKLLKDDVYREQHAQKVWRFVLEKHTFIKRLENICNSLDVEFSWEEFPLITVIAPTNRKEQFNYIVETFEKQTYKNKELIVVYNKCVDREFDFKRFESKRNYKFLLVPEELFTGFCFNYGVQYASGEYCFKMDDDDFYGENYLSDYLLNLSSVDADIFGKTPNYYYYEDAGKVFSKKDAEFKTMKVFRNGQFETKYFYIAGNTTSGKTSVLKTALYPDTLFSAADTTFNANVENSKLSVMLSDRFNMVVLRKKDIECHTWQITHEKLRGSQTKSKFNIEDLLI